MFADFEVVVVDDGSVDDTASAVAQFKASHALEVRFVQQGNAGAGVARNTGARAARGRFLVFLDDDDEPSADWLAVFAAAIESDADGRLGVMCCAVDLTDPGGNTKRRVPTNLGPAYESCVALFTAGAYMVRHDLFEAVGGFCTAVRYGEHHELALRLVPACMERGLRSQHTTQVLLTTNQDRTRAVRLRYSRAQLESVEYQLRRHRDRLKRDPVKLAGFYASGGVAAVYQGEFGKARSFFFKGVLARPLDPRNPFRLLLAFFPPLAKRFWFREATWAQAPVPRTSSATAFR
jgi:glycosyltransferase involved in cell wall biosynthesis